MSLLPENDDVIERQKGKHKSQKSAFPFCLLPFYFLHAFLTAWWLLPILARKKGYPLTQDDIGSLLFAGILGTIIGGRLGYVIFYAPEYFGDHPLQILAVWNGGMSSHGGMIGVAI